jgi:membrane-associated phospholipid phosphatase
MLEQIYHWQGANEALFLRINHYLNQYPILISALNTLSKIFFIGNFAAIYLASLVGYFAYQQLQPQASTIDAKKAIYDKFIHAGIIYAILGLTFATLKFSVNLPRPFCSIANELLHIPIDISSERCLSSFPSAHTALAIIVAYIFWPMMNNKYRAASIIVVTGVMLSRIALAMHYPADILYSSAITAMVIMISNLIYKRLYYIVSYCTNYIAKF